MSTRSAAFVVSILALSGSVAAHHGWGSYDSSQKLIFEGSVKHLMWQNPHVHIQLEHENAGWTIVLAPVSRMQLRGLSAEMIKEGTEVAVQGYPSRRKEHELRAERLRVAGKTYELR
jgi:hypothetical protein